MNWLAFGLITWIVVGLELGLERSITLRFSTVVCEPGFILPLAVFAAGAAPPAAALWSALVLGLIVDLTSPLPTQPGGIITVVGPHALGFLLTAQLVLALRGVVIRRNPLTVGVLAGVGTFVTAIVVAAVFTARSLFGDEIPFSATERLLGGLGSAVYTAITGTLLAFVLNPASTLLGFQSTRRGFGRH